MRVKLLLALAIASIVLMCTASVAFAADNLCGTTSAVPGTVSGIPTADQLTAAANNEIAAFGFPDLAAVDSIDSALVVPADTVDAFALDTPLCGVCGQIPPCDCVEKTTVVPGPKVNLGCPIVNIKTAPVNLVSPVIRPVFPTINVAPQATLTLPEVTTTLNCFDIACQPCTSINECPTARPTATPRPRDP